MKRALLLLPMLLLIAACASNDGFVDNSSQGCAPGSPIGIEAGWGDSTGANEMGGTRNLTMLVRVSNNSDEDITVKTIRADPMMMERDGHYELERGVRDANEVIAEGKDSTFELPMRLSRRNLSERGGGVRASGVDVNVTVLVEPNVSHRCRFRLPLGF
ncbi:MAG TPA: hypothetical protein VGQ76_10755 [Thermoanaerobaculia bacterium]|jgi:hypothetical protein|nr:hypothetical protein [Thermoanaerobaculia bacterium]